MFTYDWEVVEIMGAVFKITWGIWLLLPFPVFRAIEGYNAVGTESWWGIGLLIYGTLHLMAVIAGHRFYRRWLTFGAFLFWIFTVFLIWQQSHTAALLPTFTVIAFFMGLNFIRIGKLPTTMRTIVKGSAIDERIIDLGPPDGMAERRVSDE